MSKQNASHKVVLISAVMVFGLGWFNAHKHNHSPSRRFLIGVGFTFTGLSFLSDYSPEAANALSLAVATTALFSEGNGILSYLNHGGELNTPNRAEERKSQQSRNPTIKKAKTDSVGQIPGA